MFGVFGVLSRYYMDLGVSKVLGPPFPYGTFFINLIGAFVIGMIYVLGVERVAISEDIRIGLMVGFLGGFTTFSSYCLDVIRLIENDKYGYAIIYAALSTFLGFAATFSGMFLIRRLVTG